MEESDLWSYQLCLAAATYHGPAAAVVGVRCVVDDYSPAEMFRLLVSVDVNVRMMFHCM